MVPSRKERDDDEASEEKFKLPPLPSIDDAQKALAHAEKAYAQTPRFWRAKRDAEDVFVEAILKAIVDKGA